MAKPIHAICASVYMLASFIKSFVQSSIYIYRNDGRYVLCCVRCAYIDNGENSLSNQNEMHICEKKKNLFHHHHFNNNWFSFKYSLIYSIGSFPQHPNPCHVYTFIFHFTFTLLFRLEIWRFFFSSIEKFSLNELIENSTFENLIFVLSFYFICKFGIIFILFILILRLTVNHWKQCKQVKMMKLNNFDSA